ncbi:PGR5-like protein 1B, chloroplastic [Dendrobium catenatum]|uniref:PGR5-like protein 1B, chloroplastic n=1 Tax=Dendrobium catenatum TaxID=906689 RepID=A0A2I0WLB1_9ASPA|nr:PGR5-like protein 1B, chloroplastic [Dendrobium catenatum]PKU76449.1 PGR5-like protein 1B, chloroplastic [Dendrobium catenatum]
MRHSSLAHASSSSFAGGGAAAWLLSWHARLSSARARANRSFSKAIVVAAAEGPSCLFVGSIETASKEMLEALYQQARDSYYSGKPLIFDDMFDKVELKLRSYGSKSVVKYPRCSLMRQSTYADAEEDPSQVLALATVWTLLLALGSSAYLIPTILTISIALEDGFSSKSFISSRNYPFDLVPMLNSALFTVFGFAIGYPIASSSVLALKDLWMKHLVALKGACPNCGEEVFAFVKAENSILFPHGTQCHVCKSRLEFRGKVERSISRPEQRWVYGRVYLCPNSTC